MSILQFSHWICFLFVYWSKYSVCFSVGYSAVALNHVIDFKEKKQVIFLAFICSYCVFFSKPTALLHVPR